MPPDISLPKSTDDVLAAYQQTSRSVGGGIREKLKRGLETTKKRARALKLRHDMKNLTTALEEQRENLGKLALQHRPAEVNLEAELLELSKVQEELGQKQVTLESLRQTKGSGLVVKQLRQEIAREQVRQRELMIAIGLKTDSARPDMPGSAGLYSGIDQLDSSIETTRVELTPLEEELGPILQEGMSQVQKLLAFGSRKSILLALGGVVLVAVVLYLLSSIVSGPLFAGSLPRWASVHFPDDVTRIHYVNLDKLREYDRFKEFWRGLPMMTPSLAQSIRSFTEDDIGEAFTVMLENGRWINVLRTVDDFSLDDLAPKQNESRESYRGIDYVRVNRSSYLAKTDARVFCCARSEDDLKDVLARVHRDELPEWDEDLEELLGHVLGYDSYFALAGEEVSRGFARSIAGPMSPSFKGLEGVALGLRFSSSKLSLGGMLSFGRDRDAKRFEQDFEDMIPDLEDAIKEENLSDDEKEAAELGLNILRKQCSAKQAGKVARVKGSASLEDLDYLRETFE